MSKNPPPPWVPYPREWHHFGFIVIQVSQLCHPWSCLSPYSCPTAITSYVSLKSAHSLPSPLPLLSSASLSFTWMTGTASHQVTLPLGIVLPTNQFPHCSQSDISKLKTSSRHFPVQPTIDSPLLFILNPITQHGLSCYFLPSDSSPAILNHLLPHHDFCPFWILHTFLPLPVHFYLIFRY